MKTSVSKQSLIWFSSFVLVLLLGVSVVHAGPFQVRRRRGSHVIKPRDKTGIVMAPTALTVGAKERGLGFDATFQYYIGKIYESVRIDQVVSRTDWLEPLRVGIFGLDLKYILWSEKGIIPAFGVGYNGFLPVDASMSFSITDDTKESLKGKYIDNYYGVFTKKLPWAHATVGFMSGEMPKIMASMSKGINSFGNHVFFAGLSRELKSGRMLKAEVLYDLNNGRLKPAHSTIEKKDVNPFLINTYWGNLIGFNFSFMKTDNDFSVMGYFSFRLPLWPYVGG